MAEERELMRAAAPSCDEAGDAAFGAHKEVPGGQAAGPGDRGAGEGAWVSEEEEALVSTEEDGAGEEGTPGRALQEEGPGTPEGHRGTLGGGDPATSVGGPQEWRFQEGAPDTSVGGPQEWRFQCGAPGISGRWIQGGSPCHSTEGAVAWALPAESFPSAVEGHLTGVLQGGSSSSHTEDTVVGALGEGVPPVLPMEPGPFVFKVPERTVHLSREDAVDSHRAPVEAPKEKSLLSPTVYTEEVLEAECPVDHANVLQHCVQPVQESLMEVGSEEDAQSAPASPTEVANAHLTPGTTQLSRSVKEIDDSPWEAHAPTSHSKLVEEEEEAEMAPTSPTNLMTEEGQQGPATCIHLSYKETARMTQAGLIKLVAEDVTGSVDFVEDEEAEMCPASPMKLGAEEEKDHTSESLINVTSGEDVKVAPPCAGSLVSSEEAGQVLPSSIQVAGEDKLLQNHQHSLKLDLKGETATVSTSSVKMSLEEGAMHCPASLATLASERGDAQALKRCMVPGAEVAAMQNSCVMLQASGTRSLQTGSSTVSAMASFQATSSPKKQNPEMVALPSVGSLFNLVSERETLQAQTDLQKPGEETNVLVAPASPIKHEAFKVPINPVTGAKECDPEVQSFQTGNLNAQTVLKKPTVVNVLEVPGNLSNGAELQHVLASPKEQEVEISPKATDSSHKLMEVESSQVLTSSENYGGDKWPECPSNPKKRPAGEDTEALAMPKKQALEEAACESASCDQQVEQHLKTSEVSQSTAPVKFLEAPASTNKGVTKVDQECMVNPKKRQADEVPEARGSPKKQAVGEGTGPSASLKRSAAEEEMERLTNHLTADDDEEAEVAPESGVVDQALDTQASLQAVLGTQSSVQNLVLEKVTEARSSSLTHAKEVVKSLSEDQVTEYGPMVPSVTEEQSMEYVPMVHSVSEDQVTEDGPMVPLVSEVQVTEDDSLVPSNLVTSGAQSIPASSKSTGETQRVVAGSLVWGTPAVAETEEQEELAEDCAQEYPGSPMDLDDEDSLGASENMLVAESSSVDPTGTSQIVPAVSDGVIKQEHSPATGGCSDMNSITSMSTCPPSYINHGAALYPVSGANDGTLPYPPEFEKYWKATQDNPFDFAAWTDLLDYVEQENHMVACRKAFTAFFTRYPYCYGYWKKYADMERGFGYLKEAEEVFEQGLQAIPLSLDLWMHFITFLQETSDMSQPESVQRISNVFEMALAAAGMDFHSDRLWEMYAEWEKERGDLQAVTVIYDRVLSTPTHLYSHHFEKFKEHVTNNSPVDILSREEFMWLRSKVVPEAAAPVAPAAPVAGNVGTGDQLQAHEGSEEAAQVAEIEKLSDVDQQKMRELIISLREQMFKQNEAEVSKRWSFEEAIKRPYFHVKPLERAQLINWRDYLDFEITNGSHSRTIVLFERCVIACALYEEFWLKYTKYLENHTVIGTRSVFQRSCLYHLPKKPNLHLLWAAFEERQGDIEEARNILKTLDEAVPKLAMVRLRRVSLERRAGNLEGAERLLREAILESEGTPMATFYSIKLARQVLKVQNNLNKAREVLQEALTKDPENAKLYLNLLEMEFSADVKQNEGNTIHCIERVMSSNLPANTKIVFSQRRVEFLEDFGSSVKSLLTAYDEHQKLLKIQASKRKVTENGSVEEPEEKKMKEEGAAAQPAVTAATSVSLMGGDTNNSQVAASAAYNYNTWYQNYGAYSYQNSWNYNYYPQS